MTLARLAAACVATIALAASGAAQTPAKGGVVRPGTYKLEPVHTQILFGVSHLGFTTYYGQFAGASGVLVLGGPNGEGGKLDVSVPTANVITASDKLTAKLKGEDWLDAAKYPAMTFHSTAVRLTGAQTAEVTGDFTLHGVTRPIVLKARFNAAGVNPVDSAYTVGFDVEGHIQRSQFGVAAGLPRIGDDVDLIISAAFERAPS